ncbi:biotin transporter BioY [Leptolyngbya cf. ectocarpi LEGE 11479]|uniref:Biotin transporter n=1 Tax=Leptolyngbya cf. ectocarpi LEGE 11479 TaxID=1828722 RepID=A0A928ZRA9_LEPEC|nr:biotin transporter BioY [Leptolyngbya ectocarpi]MBE9067135.1 biotin transporter BioY [Leptolyngbya cf. ectocarpi LEGE 11479]
MFATAELLWALIGLILTIGGTWLEVFMTTGPWDWAGGIEVFSLGVSFQVGAVLLIGCVGGQNAAALSQIAYLSLGLLLFQAFDLQVFTQGGGVSYLREPSFGYLLGFIPAAWVCGYLAFWESLKLETLALSCLGGLLTIHGVGLVYLPLAYVLQWTGETAPALGEAIFTYSIAPIPGQLVLVCAVSVLAYGMRQIMFY